ncbi:MAG TPA: hypothetical protein VN764_04205, partial [Polyangiaceae bacterium]|nr:hypothetical protein [Polyangiaceae bacterium]
MRLSRCITLVVGSLLLTGIGCSEEAGPPIFGTGGSGVGTGGSGVGTGGSGLGTGGAASTGGSATDTGGSATSTGGGAACPEEWGTTGTEA